MSHSRKRTPVITFAKCKSQKEGKKIASKKFRRRVKVRMLHMDEVLPIKSIEITSTYDLGGDGKIYVKGMDKADMRK